MTLGGADMLQHFLTAVGFIFSCLYINRSDSYIKSNVDKKIVYEYLNEEGLIDVNKEPLFELNRNEDYTLQIMFKYGDFIFDDDNDVDARREAAKEFYNNNNTRLLKQISLGTEDIFVSEYTSIVFAYYHGENCLDNVEKVANNLKRLSYIDELRIYPSNIYNVVDDEAVFDSQYLNKNESRTEPVYYDNYPNGTFYDGSGVKIGLLDRGEFDVTEEYFNNSSIPIVHDETYDSDLEHCMNVASIFVGSSGMVPSSQIYYVDVNSDYGYTGIESLISSGVKIVNMSISAASCDNNGNYNSALEVYLDNIYYSTHVIMVASAGNGLNKSGTGGYVALPALCANVISVGSINELESPSVFSSYKIKNDVNSNPYIVAVGEGRILGYGGSKNGTSYSAPAVSAAIALYFNRYGVKPLPDVLSALLTTANHKDVNYSSQYINLVDLETLIPTGETIYCTNTQKNNGLYERTGAGRLDIASFVAFNGSQLQPNTYYTSDNYVQLQQIPINTGKVIKICLMWERYASTTTLYTLPTFDLFLKHAYWSDVASNTCDGTNIKIIYAPIWSTETYNLYLRPYSNYMYRFVNYAYRIYNYGS